MTVPMNTTLVATGTPQGHWPPGSPGVAALVQGAAIPPAVPKSERTRQRILVAALELFQERGFEATTMRDIAARAEVAVGAAYYYFRTKEELVLAFYVQMTAEAAEPNRRICAEVKDIQKRIEALLQFKFDQFLPHRKFLRILFSRAADPDSALSPFSEATAPIRERAIQVFRDALAGGLIKAPKDLLPYLPWLFWIYQMGLLLFWIHDRSENQRRTRFLLERSRSLIFQLLRMARLPFMRPLRRALIVLLTGLGVPRPMNGEGVK